MSKKKDESIWILILIFILAMPFILAGGGVKDDDDVSFKKKVTNGVGLLVLGTFILAIIFTALWRWFDDGHTKETLDKTAQAFATSNNEVIQSWARGEIVDHWGNTLVLERSGDEIVMLSKGLDGEAHTSDDLESEPFSVPERPRPKSQSKPWKFEWKWKTPWSK